MNKILAICTSPDKGGLELYFVNMVNYFHSVDQNITAVCKKDSKISKLIKSPVININKINAIKYTLCELNNNYIDEEKIDVIHVSWTKDLLFSVLVKVFSE